MLHADSANISSTDIIKRGTALTGNDGFRRFRTTAMRDLFNSVAVLIPAYNPDRRLPVLVRELKLAGFFVAVVNDGSVSGLEHFKAIRNEVDLYLEHGHNRGKGAALKTGLNALGERNVVSADADGQHRIHDICRVAEALVTSSGNRLVLGERDFSGKVPFRSRFGNLWTRWTFFLLTGMWIRDTQTGLRGIPAALIKRVASLPGDRYEYEMAMLTDARHHQERPLSVTIDTIYRYHNQASHFSPLVDAWRIYRSLFGFCFASVITFLIDNTLYVAAMAALANVQVPRLLVAMLFARAVSANVNYALNRYVVFRKKGSSGGRSYYRYLVLVIVVVLLSWGLTKGLSALFGIEGTATLVIKIIADTLLFFGSYFVQKHLVFGRRLT